MKIRYVLLAAAAANSVAAGAVDAAGHKQHHGAPHSATSANAQLVAQVKALSIEVEALKSEVGMQRGNQETATAQLQTTQSALQSTQSQVQNVQTQLAATPAISKEQVNTEIAGAIEKEHHNDKFYFKGITITPGGFLEAAGIYRSKFQGDDIASSFNVPFPSQSHAAHDSEGRFSARQSRISLLAQGDPNAHTQLSMYGEFDFQGGAQTSNSNQSNSYVPRIRNLYSTIDWNERGYGIHILAGQNWSLLTLQSKGMSPRSEVTPPQIDAQYIPGFAWARQPGVRVTADFLDHQLWLGVAAENPQTTFGGTGVPAGITSAILGNGSTAAGGNQVNPSGSFQQFYNGVGSSLSLSHVPDFIGKAALETVVGGHKLHVEGFAIYRTFSERFDGTTVVEGSNHDAHGTGYGGSVNLEVVPKIFDAQFSYTGGRGIGRYGSAGLADTTFDKEGNIHPIKEYMMLAGGTLHATKALDVYGFAGEEVEHRQLYDAGSAGYGVATLLNTNCMEEGGATCAGNVRRIRQLTGGFWDKFYQGSFGRAQIGIQYSYTQRQLFQDVNGLSPQANNSMGFVSFRYYPF